MNSLLIYLLKVSAGTALLYSGYLLFFRKDTFYLRNRIFLMVTLIIPAILPLIKIPVISVNPVPSEPAGVFAGLIYTEPSPLTSAAGAIRTEPIDIYPILTGIYFAAAGLLLLRVLMSLLSTYAIIKKGTIRTNNFPKVITTEQQLPPFSFFPYVVVPAEDFNTGNCNDILDHEFAHIKQGHTFDLILGELFIAFQWFNPFVWLVKRSMILNHEYLADKVSLITNKCPKEYQYKLLNLQPRLKHISLVHSFDSLIKNRIIMINKTPSTRLAAVKNFLILPVVAIAVYAFATPEYPSDKALTTKSAINIYQANAIVVKNANSISLKKDGTVFNDSLNKISPRIIESKALLIDKSAPEVVGEKEMNGAIGNTRAKKAVNEASVVSQTGDQEQKLTESSISQINRFLRDNIFYPEIAKETSDSAEVYISVTMHKGGTIKECKVLNEKDQIRVPVLGEVSIFGYNTSQTPVSSAGNSANKNEHLALKAACLRVANKLTVNEVPEWRDNDLEFAMMFKFMLK